MDDIDHVVAARHHAERAGSGGDDSSVQASLAHVEALLAVAAAIDRLATALGRDDAPGPSPSPAPAYKVAEVRRRYPNAYTPWTPEADAALLAAWQAGHDVATLADTFGRQPSAIRSRLNRVATRT